MSNILYILTIGHTNASVVYPSYHNRFMGEKAPRRVLWPRPCLGLVRSRHERVRPEAPERRQLSARMAAQGQVVFRRVDVEGGLRDAYRRARRRVARDDAARPFGPAQLHQLGEEKAAEERRDAAHAFAPRLVLRGDERRLLPPVNVDQPFENLRRDERLVA